MLPESVAKAGPHVIFRMLARSSTGIEPATSRVENPLSVMLKVPLGPPWVRLGSRDDAIRGSLEWHAALSLND
jgi:hypothetical protein